MKNKWSSGLSGRAKGEKPTISGKYRIGYEKGQVVISGHKWSGAFSRDLWSATFLGELFGFWFLFSGFFGRTAVRPCRISGNLRESVDKYLFEVFPRFIYLFFFVVNSFISLRGSIELANLTSSMRFGSNESWNENHNIQAS